MALSSTVSKVELEFGMLHGLWREENRSTRRKVLGAGTRTNNKLSPHMKSKRESNRGHIGGR